MRSKSQVWVSVFLFTFFCALIPSGGLFAQQAKGALASSQAAQSIDQLTGPIALYPDPLIFQILAASTNVETLKSFAGWMGKNAKLKGSELQDAAEKAGFDAALVALPPFPQVIQMMAQKPDWTKALGQAFTADKDGIFDSIWRLSGQAQAAGQSDHPRGEFVTPSLVEPRTGLGLPACFRGRLAGQLLKRDRRLSLWHN